MTTLKKEVKISGVGIHSGAPVNVVVRRSDVPNFCAIALRMVAVPLLCLALFRLCGITGNLLMAVMIPASAPTAAMVMMLSAKYQGDGIEASRIVSFSHLVSIVTMPLILTLCPAVG